MQAKADGDTSGHAGGIGPRQAEANSELGLPESKAELQVGTPLGRALLGKNIKKAKAVQGFGPTTSKIIMCLFNVFRPHGRKHAQRKHKVC